MGKEGEQCKFAAAKVSPKGKGGKSAEMDDSVDRRAQFSNLKSLPEDPTESLKEKRMSLNLAKRESARGISSTRSSFYGREDVGAGHDELFISLKDLLDREQKRTPLRKRNITLKGVTKKMIFALRLKTKKRSFHIDESKNATFFIMHLDELTDEECDAIWYNDKEMEQIKWENADVGALMDQGMSMEEADGRGLEGTTEDGAWAKYKIRKDAINAVLDEFDEQFDSGAVEWDMDKLAAAYKETSEESMSEALRKGEYDENAVADFVNETSRETREMWKKIDQAKLLTPQLRAKPIL